MKSASSSTWLLGLVLGFILLFTAYIILTINYSKTVRIKNEMISMVEKYEGLNTNSVQLVNNYLASINYNMKGECTDDNNSGVYGADNLQATSLVEAQSGEKYYYCVKKYKGVGTTRYYQVAIFYKFNLPVVGATGNFAVRGVTGNFQSKDEAIYAKNVDGSFDAAKPSGGGSTTPPPSLSSKYTVSFNLNGGNGSIPAQTVEYGTPASEPPKPTRDGYTFISWQLNGNEYNFAQPVRSNITLRARWLKNSIAGSTGTGSGGGSSTGGSATGGNVSSDVPSGTIDDTAEITSWSQVSHNCGILIPIVADYNGGTVSGSGSYKVACVSNGSSLYLAIPSRLTRPGYKLKCWANESNTCVNINNIASYNTIIHAVWEKE